MTSSSVFVVRAMIVVLYVMVPMASGFRVATSLRCGGRRGGVSQQQERRKSIVLASTSSTSEGAVNTVVPETSPLPPHTFAGMVEQGILERFPSDEDGRSPVGRILESWRLVEMGYEHREYVGDVEGDGDDSSATLAAAEDSDMHQHCISYVRDLPVKAFWDASKFPWCKKLSKKYRAIREEFLTVMSDQERLQKEGNNVWAGALTDDASSYGVGWKTLVLMDRGLWDETNVNLFPVTAKAVRDCGAHVVEVFFASMEPNSSIKKHSDFTNFVLTSHLPVDIPYSGQNKCRLTIGDETREWINGEVIMFDTSILHDAVNESDKTRYILMLRLWHPDLTEAERNALQFTYDCLSIPDLVSSDPKLKALAEKEAKARKTFPVIQKGKRVVKGFGGGGMSGTGRKNKKSSKRAP